MHAIGITRYHSLIWSLNIAYHAQIPDLNRVSDWPSSFDFRNWIVFALNNKTLVPAVTGVIKRLESVNRCVNPFYRSILYLPVKFRLYDSKAILLNEECAQLLVSLLSGLSCINFKLSDFAAEEQTASIYYDREVTEDKPKEIPTKKHKKRTNIIILDQ